MSEACWELERYDWAALRAQGSAQPVPDALRTLSAAVSAAEARDAYWRIDNTVVVQGALYEAAVATTACALVLVHRSTSAGRPRLLELLVQLGSGDTAPAKVGLGNGDIRLRCLRELLPGVSTYIDLLERGHRDEQGYCVDLLGLCCEVDPSLRARIRWYLEKCAVMATEEALRALARSWIEELQSTAARL